MRQNTTRYYHSSHYCPVYPNEADINYYRHKLLKACVGIIYGIALTISIVMLTAIM